MSSSQSIRIGDERKAENQIKGPTLRGKNRERTAKYRRCTDRRYLWKVKKNLRRLRTSELRAIVRRLPYGTVRFTTLPVLSQRPSCAPGLSLSPVNSSSSSSPCPELTPNERFFRCRARWFCQRRVRRITTRCQ
jgi:hypothetical protein